MDKKDIRQSEDIEIDVRRILESVWNKAWIVAIVAVAAAIIALAVTYFGIAPKYKAAAWFYVNNSSLSVGDASFSISSGDLSTSRNLVESYIVILNSRKTLLEVIDYAGVNRSYSSLKNMLSASAVNETEIFEIVVTSEDPLEAEKIANAIAYILPNRISDIIEGTSAKVVDTAVVPTRPSSPNYTTNTIVGFLVGMVATVVVLVLMEIFDVTIRSEEDVAACTPAPILAEVPDMTASGKGGGYRYGKYYRYYSRKKYYKYSAATKYGDTAAKNSQPAEKAPKHADRKQPVLMGEKISFAASEAYKLLRTKLQFSFSDENNSRVIGLSSALSGEGKSLTAVNLAYTLSQLEKKVVLVDCDMRRPTLAEKLNINKKPGLSSYLTGQSGLLELTQDCNLPEREKAFHVISAGQNPPNPIELLSSARMVKGLELLRKHYDYVILDLPPVCEVSDAMAVAKETDGMLLVVRQHFCDRIVLQEAARQFEFIDARILGIVYNCTNEHGGGYGNNYGYYKRYYRRNYYRKYYRRYAYNYEHNDRSVQGAEGDAQKK